MLLENKLCLTYTYNQHICNLCSGIKKLLEEENFKDLEIWVDEMAHHVKAKLKALSSISGNNIVVLWPP